MQHKPTNRPGALLESPVDPPTWSRLTLPPVSTFDIAHGRAPTLKSAIPVADNTFSEADG